jgi:hypothetical protein
MARKPQTLDALATGVFEAVAKQRVVKTAEVSYVSTELGKLMQKVASNLRTEANGPRIDYTDLAKFRIRYDI